MVDLKGSLEWRQVADCIIVLSKRVEVLENSVSRESPSYLDARVKLLEEELAKVEGSLGERLNLLWGQQPKVMERLTELETRVEPHRPNADAESQPTIDMKMLGQINRATESPPKCLECQQKGMQISAQAALIYQLRAGIRKLQELL